MITLYPDLSHTRSGIEIVDARNRPIGVMPYGSVVRQRLRYRSVAMLLRDSAGRFLLSFQKGSGWNFSFIAPVLAGQAYETCAALTLRKQWDIQGRMLSIGLLPPCEENGNCFVAIFEARLPQVMIPGLTGEPERHLLLSYDELRGLNTHFNDMLTPYVRIVLQNGYIRP